MKGSATYANEDFKQTSGFSEDEILGKNHSTVRHPDMPLAAFQNLWDDLKKDKPCMRIARAVKRVIFIEQIH